MRPLLFALLFCIAPSKAVFGSGGVPADSTAPKGITAVLEEAKLGLRLETGAFYWSQRITPLATHDLSFLKRTVSPSLSFRGLVYGLSVGIGFQDAELFGSFYTNKGLHPESGLRWEGGERAIPLKFGVKKWKVHLQYFFAGWLGAGLKYQDWRTSAIITSSPVIQGRRVHRTFFQGSQLRIMVAPFIPVQYEWGNLRAYARAGLSIYGKGVDYYYTGFVAYQERPDVPDPRSEFGPTTFSREGSLSSQFGEVSIEHPLRGVPIRATLRLQRIKVPGMSRELWTSFNVRVGLPF